MEQRGSSLKHDQLNVLDTWYMVEQFSPPPIPSPTRQRIPPGPPPQEADGDGRPGAGAPVHQVIDWRAGEDLPWDVLVPPRQRGGGPAGGEARDVRDADGDAAVGERPASRPRGGRTGTRSCEWRHTCFLGCYAIEDVYGELQDVFDDDGSRTPRAAGTGACAVVELDGSGRLRPQAVGLSAALWSVGRAKDPGCDDPTWLLGFHRAERAFAEGVAEFEAVRAASGADPEGGPHGDVPSSLPLDADGLGRLVALAHKAAGVQGIPRLAAQAVRIETRRVAVDADGRGPGGPSASTLVNGFVLGELLDVRESLEDDDIGDALWQFLAPARTINTAQRSDVRGHPGKVDAQLSAARIPLGRWPADPDRHLTRGQQFAVNQALLDIDKHGDLFAVNGPQEAERTVLLREIAAGNVVERARRLARLTDPRSAFTGGPLRWRDDGAGRTRTIRRLAPELTGFEMGVVGADDEAAEALAKSLSIPGGAGQRRAGGGSGDRDEGTPGSEEDSDAAREEGPGGAAWGPFAACLEGDRERFGEAFRLDVLADRSADAGASGPLADRERQPEACAHAWHKAREEFLRAEQHAQALLRRRVEADNRRVIHVELPGRMADERKAIAAATAQMRDAEQAAVQLRDRRDRAEHDRRDLEGRLAELDAQGPGPWATLRTIGSAHRRWRSRRRELSASLKAAAAHARTAAQACREADGKVADCAARLSSALHTLQRLRRSASQIAVECAKDGESFGRAYPLDLSAGDAAREERAPWLDAEVDAARSDLFAAAVRLHEAFVFAGGSDVRRGMAAAADVVAGETDGLTEPVLLAAWQLFFLAVPVVSATFASTGRMFAGLGREALGWLFVDDAGRIAPQLAVRALWGVKRAVVAGDPLHTGPAAPVPGRAMAEIARLYGIETTWLAPGASVQALADRVSAVGTVAAGADGRCTWVGSPLRIDRHPGPPPSGSAGGDRAAEDGAEGGSDHVVTATVA